MNHIEDSRPKSELAWANIIAVRCPNLNPIEEAFSKVKRLLREAEARTRKGLIEAMV